MKKTIRYTAVALGLLAVTALTLGPAINALAQNGALVYFPQGAASLEVVSGGDINLASGGDINLASGAGLKLANIANYQVNGVSPTGIVKSGTVTLDGSNPTPITTGLTTVTTAVLSLNTSTAPGDDPVYFTETYSGGTVNVYAWKNTGGTDPTLVASTNNTATVDWIAVGS